MPQKKVPFIIKQASKAFDADVSPTVRLLGQIFLSTYLSEGEPAQQEPPSRERQVGKRSALKPAAVRNGPAAVRNGPDGSGRAAIQIREVKGPYDPHPRPVPVPKPVILDAVIVDEVIATDCLTCGGSQRVGRRGHEVSCPSCCR